MNQAIVHIQSSLLNGLFLFSLFLTLAAGPTTAAENVVSPSVNGIQIPKNYKNWRLIGTSHRSDNNSLRAILGNHIAIKAARNGNTKPWPDGSILAKLVWKNTEHPAWKTATVPGKFIHAEFMIKDKKKYASTAGWGFARWKGMQQTPYGEDPSFTQECMGCHSQVKANDSVFTFPAVLPE